MILSSAFRYSVVIGLDDLIAWMLVADLCSMVVRVRVACSHEDLPQNRDVPCK